MKRCIAIPICLILLLSIGCSWAGWDLFGKATPEPIAAQATPQEQDVTIEPTATPSATPTAEPTATPYVPDLSGLPIVCTVQEEIDRDANEATAFEFDIDFDGNEEKVFFRCDADAQTTTITVDSESIVLDGARPDRMILIDLDPETLYANLLVSIERMSGDFCTTELHYRDGRLEKGAEVFDLCIWDDEQQALIFYETTEMLGTRVGVRSHSGEDLHPDTDWLTVSWLLTEDDLMNNRDLLIEMGELLHCTRDVPCEIDGREATIAKDSYLYLVGFNETHDTAEVRTEDGVSVMLHLTFEDGTYRIAGKAIDRYFDNLFYAG